MTYPKIPKHKKGESQDVVNMLCEASESTALNKFEAVAKRL